MKLSNPPFRGDYATYNRVFVERGGKVYWGYQDKPSTYQRAPEPDRRQRAVHADRHPDRDRVDCRYQPRTPLLPGWRRAFPSFTASFYSCL